MKSSLVILLCLILQHINAQVLIGFAEEEYLVPLGSDSVEVEVTVLEGNLTGNATVQCITADGTAEANSDYTPVDIFITLSEDQPTFTSLISILDTATPGQDFTVELSKREGNRGKRTTDFELSTSVASIKLMTDSPEVQHDLAIGLGVGLGVGIPLCAIVAGIVIAVLVYKKIH